MRVRTNAWCRRCRAMSTVKDWADSACRATDIYGSVAVPLFARSVRLRLACGHGHTYVVTLKNLLAMSADSPPRRWRFLERAIQEAERAV